MSLQGQRAEDEERPPGEAQHLHESSEYERLLRKNIAVWLEALRDELPDHRLDEIRRHLPTTVIKDPEVLKNGSTTQITEEDIGPLEKVEMLTLTHNISVMFTDEESRKVREHQWAKIQKDANMSTSNTSLKARQALEEYMAYLSSIQTSIAPSATSR